MSPTPPAVRPSPPRRATARHAPAARPCPSRPSRALRRAVEPRSRSSAAGSPARPRIGGGRRLAASPRSLPTYFARYRAASRASPSVPEPTGRSPSSLMWTKPWPQAVSIAPWGRSGRPRNGRAARGRPDATPAPTGTGTPRRARRGAAGRSPPTSAAERRRVVAARPGVRQRAEPVEPVRGAVPADLAPRPARRIGPAVGVGSTTGRDPRSAPADRNEPPPSAASG